MSLFGIPAEGGLVRTIVIILTALLVLAYFGFNLRNIVNSPTFQDNWSFLWNGIVNIWDNYLSGPAIYLWNIFVNLIWNPAIDNLEKMKNNEPTTVNTASPRLSEPAPTVQ